MNANSEWAWCLLLVYTSVTPCICTNSFFRERHGFGATAQCEIKKGTNIRHGLGTAKAHFWHSLEQFRHSLGTV